MPSLVLRFRPFIWFLIIAFTITSTPHIELVFPYMARLIVSEAHAAVSAPDPDPEAVQDQSGSAMSNAVIDSSVQATAAGEGTGGTPSKASGESDAGATGISPATVEMSLFTGAASTSIPIEVPPGRKGMAPHLALKYNSYQKNGWIGVGWSLDMGSIQQSTKWGVVYDMNGYVATIDGASVELVRIELDGPGGNGQVFYNTRVEGARSKYYHNISTRGWEVTALDGTRYYYGTTTDSRQDFDGGNKIFKWALDTVVDTNGNCMAISYYPRTGDGNIYLKQIDYTGQWNGSTCSGTTNQVSFVTFTAEQMGAMPYLGDGTSYATNYPVQTTMMLSAIRTYAKYGENDVRLVKSYELAYHPNWNGYTAHSVLASVTRKGSDAITQLPPTAFVYQTAENNFANAVSWPTSPALKTGPAAMNFNWSGDFDGDGRTDHMSWVDGTHLSVYLSTGAAFAASTWQVGQIYTDGNGNPRLWLGDFNGDGKTDVATMDGSGNIYVYTSTGDGFQSYTNAWGIRAYVSGGIANTRVGDFNGDGIADLMSWYNADWVKVYISDPDNHRFVGQDGARAGEYLASPPASPNTPNNLWACDLYKSGAYNLLVWLGDFNGDGKTDIAAWDNNQSFTHLNVHLSTTDSGGHFTGFSRSPWPATLYSGASGPYVWTGDFNGDGKTDIAGYLSTLGNSSLAVHLSTGSSFARSNQVPTYEAWSLSRDLHYNGTVGFIQWFADFNADGKTDLAIYDDANHLYILKSIGNGFSTAETWDITTYYDGYTGVRVWPGDYDGDGKTDMAAWNSSTSGNTLDVYLQNRVVPDRQNDPAPQTGFPDLLYAIHNGIGGSTILTYTPSTVYVNTLLPFVLQTVSQKDVYDGRATTPITTGYSYTQGLYYAPERDFYGFGSATTTQMNGSVTEATTVSYFHQDAIRKGQMYSQITTSREGHTREVANTWEVLGIYDNSPSDGPTCNRVDVCFPAMRSSTATNTDNVQDGQYTWQVDYDYHPGVLKVSMEHKHGMGTTDDIVTHFDYNSFGKPTDIIVTDISDHMVSRKWMSYDARGNLLTETACKSDNPANDCGSPNITRDPTVTYAYYDNGNPWTITGAGNDLYPGCTTTMTYDSATSTYVSTTANCVGHVTTTMYDPGIGKVVTMIPPYLQGTSYGFSYAYDPLGRISTETRPDGGVTTYDYMLFGDPATQYVQKTEEIHSGLSVIQHDTYSLFDGLGRTYRATTTGSNDTGTPRNIVLDTDYDNVGRVWKKWNPYFSDTSRPNYWTEHTYDGLSRVVDVKLPDDNHISTSYEGRCKVVTNQRGLSTRSCYDVFEKLRGVTDAIGTLTTYDYDLLGNLAHVIRPNPENASLFITTSMTYDSMSKKKSMNDPDMGYWTYIYDKSGNLTSQTDAKYQQTNFFYDQLNRVHTKTTATDTVTYTYDACVTGVPSCSYATGKLTDVSAENNSGAKEYKKDTVLELDIMQRITKSRKSIGPLLNPVSTVIAREYDTAGRMRTLTYFPDDPIKRKQIAYAYDTTFDPGTNATLTAGNIASITNVTASSTLVMYSDYNALNKHKKATSPKAYPYSVETDYNYDPAMGRLSSLTTTRLNGGSPVETYQALAYQFDANGNAHIVTDTVNNIVHDYEYDSLDRLTSAVGTGTGAYTQSFTYDTLGNILTKSDVGTYHYNYADKPHAVRNTVGVLNIGLGYDANGNMTQRAVSGGPTLDITWTTDNRPLTIGTTTYTYDGNGSRVRKMGASGTVLYFGEIYEERNSIPVFHIFAGSTRVMSLRSDGNQTIHGNHLNSASIVTDDNGARKEKVEYDPFGTYRVHETYSFPLVNYTFTDQEYDDESGLYNYKARLYDPVLGRFISPDSIVPEPGNLQAFNRYSYCVNNPVTYVDPSGNDFGLSLLIGMAIMAIIGAVAGGTVAAVNGTNIGQGMLTGAISGSLVYAGGMVGGAMAGVINASITGGDMGQGALYGAIGAAAGGLTGMGVGAMGIKDAFVQAGVSIAAGGLVGGGITALAGGNFGQGFVNGAVGAAAGYFASIGMTKIMKQSPTNNSNSPQQAQEQISSSLNVSYGTVTPAGYVDISGSLIIVGGGYLINSNGIYPYNCYGVSGGPTIAGLSITYGGSDFVPGEWFTQYQRSQGGTAASWGRGDQSGPFTETGGGTPGYSAQRCYIQKNPIVDFRKFF